MAAAHAQNLTEFASLELANVAVASLAAGATAGQVDLLLTTFSPTATQDGVYRLDDLAAVKAGGGADAVDLITIDDDATWPNQADAVPAGAIDGVADGAGVVTAGGFFVAVPGYPSKATGSVDLFLDGAAKRQLSTDKDKVTDELNIFAGCFIFRVVFLEIPGETGEWTSCGGLAPTAPRSSGCPARTARCARAAGRSVPSSPSSPPPVRRPPVPAAPPARLLATAPAELLPPRRVARRERRRAARPRRRALLRAAGDDRAG